MRTAPACTELPPEVDTFALRNWLEHVGNADIIIDWSAESLTVYGAGSILERQKGYAQPGIKQGHGWLASWIVIGDVHSDPIIIDTKATSGAVFFARHGQGTWNLKPLAGSLQAFRDMLAIWCKYYYSRYKGSILDADCEVTNAFRDEIRVALKPVLRPDELETFLMAAAG